MIVQRALDLRIILRQGTRYAFARGTLWVLQAIVFTFLAFRLFHFAHASGRVGATHRSRGIRGHRSVSAFAHRAASLLLD